MKTVKVRIAVSVDPEGNWNSFGYKEGSEDDLRNFSVEGLEPGEAHYWVEAELPIPEVLTVQGKVEEDKHKLEGE